MELREKAANLPTQPGVYLFQDAAGKILYVGKANSLRNRVKSYFLESRWQDAKTGSLVREIAGLDYIVVDNEREALALENNLIKQHKPKFNILLRDDKTYPYIRYTAFEKYPRVYVTRRLNKDGSIYFGPYFPASLAYRLVHLVHKHFLVPSCTVDLTRFHPRPCLQYYIHRCLGPCVEGLVADERYTEAARDVRLFLEGRRNDLSRSLEERMQRASEEQRYEQAAGYRDLLRTHAEMEERQKIAAAAGDDTDVVAWYAEPPQVAVNLFHLRGGRVVDRRDFYWEDLEAFEPAEFLPSLLKQLYLDSAYLPRYIHTPMDFEERGILESVLAEKARHRIEILPREREIRGVDLYHLEPERVAGRLLREAFGDLALDLRRAHQLVFEVALAEILGALGGMDVRVDDAGEHQLAAQVDRAGLRPDQRAHGLIAADGDYGIAAKRERRCDGALRILGVNAAVKQEEIGGSIRGAGCSRGGNGYEQEEEPERSHARY